MNKIHRFFIADDDQDDRMLLKEALRELNPDIQVEDFDNGVTLMDALLKQDELPNALFLDLNMPLMNGEECLSDIRNEPNLSKLPIIIYSTYADDMKIDLIRQKGADLYLVKPVSYERLKMALHKCLEYVEHMPVTEKGKTEFLLRF